MNILKFSLYPIALLPLILSAKPALSREFNAKCPNGAFVKEIVVRNGKPGIRCYKSNTNGQTTSSSDDRYWTRYFISKVSSNHSYETAICPGNSFISEIIYSDARDHVGIRCREIFLGNKIATKSSDYWTREFVNTSTGSLKWATCNNSGIGAEVILQNGVLSLRCRLALTNDRPLIFEGSYWTRNFPEAISFSRPTSPTNIPGLSLPIQASNGSSTWNIDSRGGVTGSITYSVGSGSGSKKYSSGVVIEFLDGSTYYAETTKTVGRPFHGTRRGTHSFNGASIPISKINQVRRVFVNYSVDRGLGTIREWKNYVLGLLEEADVDYQKLKENGLVRDAARAAAAGS